MPDSFESHLARTLASENPKFVQGLQKVASALDEFYNQIQESIPEKESEKESEKEFNLTTSIQGIVGGLETEFQYVLNLEVVETGDSYDLLSFLFCPYLDEQDFPLRITTEPEKRGGQLDCTSLEDFEKFLIERAKNIHRTIQMLSIMAD